MTGSELDKAQAKRKYVRGSITRMGNKLKEELSKEKADLSEVEYMFEKLTEKNAELQGLNAEVMACLEKEDQIMEEMEQVEVYEEQTGRILHKARRYLKEDGVSSTQSIKSSGGSTKVQKCVKLPTLQLPSFDGNIFNWIPFWDSFKATVDDNEDLPVVQKFTYLRAQLKGDAFGVVDGLSLTSKNYAVAVDLLKERYGKTEVLSAAHSQQIVHLKCVTSVKDIEGLRKLHNACEINIRGIENLDNMNVDKGAQLSLFVPLILTKLPEEIVVQWHKEAPYGKEFDLRELMRYLLREIEGRERYRLMKSSADGASGSTSYKNESTSSGNGQKSKYKGYRGKPFERPSEDHPPTGAALHASTKRTCIFCGTEEHLSYKCEKIGDLSYEQRVERIRKAKACFRCFRVNHMLKQCELKAKIKCYKCKGDHHSFLCKKVSDSKKNCEKEEQALATTTSSIGSPKSGIILQTARVVALGNKSKSRKVTCLFDTGSDRSYVTSKLVKELELNRVGAESLSIGTFGSAKGKNSICPRVEFMLRSVVCPDQKDDIKIAALVINQICRPFNRVRLPEDSPILEHFSKQELADNYAGEQSVQVDILIGSDLYWTILTGPIYQYEHAPVAIQSRVGLILHGPISQNAQSFLSESHATNLFVGTEADSVYSVLRNFWELDAMGIKGVEETPYTKEEDEAMQSFKQGINFSDGRYSVRLPWKSEYQLNPQCVPKNKGIAKKRVFSTVQRLKGKPDLLQKYHDALREFVTLGFTEEVPAEEINVVGKIVSYLPHRPVVKEDSSTTKIRPVFDASAHEKDKPSLNDCILTGPSLNPEVLSLLLKFRTKPIALVGDLEKAFPQIKLDVEDIDATRYFWFESMDAILREEAPREYRMKRVLFGINASPFLLNATIKHHLETYPQESGVLKQMKEQLYVDDWISGASSTEEGYKNYVEAKEIMAAACFNMRKWKTNDVELRKLISDSESKSDVKVLGMEWNIDTDKFSFGNSAFVTPGGVQASTKRKLLSQSSKLYDPLGLLSPFTIRVKLVFQMLWRRGVAWDDPLPQDVQERWDQWSSELDSLSGVRIPRYVFIEKTEVELHGFCDASKDCFAAVIYVRDSTSSTSSSRLLLAKTRVAPIKKISLPRLELMGAVLLSRLLQYVQRNISDLAKVPYILWTDARIVYHWIRGCPSKQKMFVSNRVSEIQNDTETSRWRYCPGSKNPADLPTRGIDVPALIERTDWWNGPEWLRSKENWPSQSNIGLKEEEQVALLVEHEEVTTMVVNRENQFIEDFLRRYSSYNKMLRVFAYIRRFVLNFVSQHSHAAVERSVLTGPIQADELKIVEFRIVSLVQREAFQQEYSDLKDGKPLARESCLIQFDPHLDEEWEVIRVGGRIQDSDLEYNEKHPMLLPFRHRFVELYVMDVHLWFKHLGVRDILVHSRQKFWILRGRQVIRNLLSSCIVCRKDKARPYNVKMGLLPRDRITRAAPFEVVGVDFAGPLYAKLGQTCTKSYICLYTCAVTRALHLELVEKLSTEDFLLSFRRFIARRGLCRTIYSDNAATFQKGNEELQSLFKMIEMDKLVNFASSKGITWKFIVPAAPWWGGFYERLVRSVKMPLRKILGNAHLTFQELETILCEIEAVVNSRPLTFVSDDLSQYLDPLSPSHFLVGKRLTQLPPVNVETEIVSTHETLTRKRQLYETLLDTFWERWTREYLLELGRLQKWLSSTAVAKEGDVVLIEGRQGQRQHWNLGVIVKLFTGRDGQSRFAEVKTKGGLVLRRPVQKLYMLEASGKDSSEVQPGGSNAGTDFNAKLPPEVESVDAPQEVAASVGGEDVGKRIKRNPSRFKDFELY